MKQTNTLYSRYGLALNPFRLNVIDSIDLVSRVHMNLSIDDNLALLKEEVFFKKKNHNVFLIGDVGMGKTHRVLIAHAEALKNSLFSRLVSFSNDNSSVMFQFLNAILPKGSALLSNDKWQREIAKLKKQVKKEAYDPHHTAQIVADALNVKTPSFILIDNLDEVQMFSDNQSFFSFLFTLSSLLNPGVLLMATMTPAFASVLTNEYPQGASFFKMKFIEPLTDEEAEKILSKWMESYRLVHGLFPLFPFNSPAVNLLNSQSHGNTRCLLDLADMALTAASYQKAANITDTLVKEALLSVSEKKPSLLKEKAISPLSPLNTWPEPSEGPSKEKCILPLPDSVVSVETNLTPDTADLIREGRPNVVSNSDLAEQINPDKGGKKKQESDERIDENIPHSFSASPRPGIKKIDSSSGSSFPLFLQQTDENVLNDAIDSLEQGEDLDYSLMKIDDGSFVSSDDNGSIRKPSDVASIMHQAKKQRTTNDETDGSCEKEIEEKLDTTVDCWQPVDLNEDDLNFIDEDDKGPVTTNESDQVGTTCVQKQEKSAGKKVNDTIISSSQSKRKTDVDLKDSFKHNDNFCPDHDNTMDKNEKRNTAKKKTKKPSVPLVEKNKENDSTSDEKKTDTDRSHLKNGQSQSEHTSSVRSVGLDSSLKRVLRVRCPECSKDFTIEIDEDTRLLTCPFCDFQGEL
jgi:hypothetical protein